MLSVQLEEAYTCAPTSNHMAQPPTASEARGGSVPPEAGPSLPKHHQQQSDSSNRNKLKSVDLLRLTLVSGNGTLVNLEDRSKDPVQRPPRGQQGIPGLRLWRRHPGTLSSCRHSRLRIHTSR